MSGILGSSGKVFHEKHLFIQFFIGTVNSSLAILIIFAGMSLPELLLQSTSLIYFKN